MIENQQGQVVIQAKLQVLEVLRMLHKEGLQLEEVVKATGITQVLNNVYL